MVTFGQGLANLGAVYGGAQNSYDAIQQRKQQQEQFQLSEMIRRQAYQQNQDQLMRSQNAARAAVGAIGGGGAAPGGLPQQVQVPGAMPMPGQGSPQMPPVSQPPPMIARPNLPQPPVAQPQGAQGGGIGLDELGNRVRAQLGPDADPLTVYEAMSNYQNLMKPREADEYKRIGLMLQEMRVNQGQERLNQTAAKPNPAAETAKRELDNKALSLGIDPTGMDDAALRKAVATKAGSELGAKDAKRDKPTTPQWRYETAKNDTKNATDNIRAIIVAHPNAVGAYGKLYKGMGGIAGFLYEPEPEDAAAANALKAQFERLSDSLGVAGTYGGMGSSTLVKRWDNVIGGNDWVTNPQRLTDELNSISGELQKYTAPAGETNDDIDAIISKYNQPGQ